ncbi:MAG: hypothetical protein IPH52_14175 [Leptospiraceae bacterium]|nr:hypothetical protein [Leptospiraceae bacterium]
MRPTDFAGTVKGNQVVEWKVRISIDVHKYRGPDVFHIGFKSPGKNEEKNKGHIFLDCVPYFRNVE